MKNFRYIAFALFTLLWAAAGNKTFGQGCSDAGLCTLNSIKPGADDSTAISGNRVSAGLSYGSADHGIAVFAAYFEYHRDFNDRFAADIKLTTLSQNGNGISVFGPGDIFVSGDFKLNRIFSFTLGFKIPLTDGNKMLDGRPLPMDYQSGLGTFDLLLGAGVRFNHLQFVLGYQQPLTQNSNTFLSSETEENPALSAFQSTNKYIRSGDVLLRISYAFNIGNKFSITPGVLPIFHLQNDKYTTAGGVQTEITGSRGLTINGNVFLDYRFDEKNTIQFNIGAPLKIRESRPDGLTRHFIITLEYGIRF